MNTIKKLFGAVAFAVVVLVGMTAISASAWPKPEVSVSCTEIKVKEVAPDSDWVKTAYWTIDGVPGQFARGHTEIISDTTSTNRIFVVRWFDNYGNQLDWVPSDPAVRNLEICQAPTTTITPTPEPTVPVTTVTPTPEPTVPVVPVINGPADPIPATPVVDIGTPAPAPTPAVQGALPVTGGDSEQLAWAAAFAVALGFFCVLGGRRRNAAEHKVITTVG